MSDFGKIYADKPQLGSYPVRFVDEPYPGRKVNRILCDVGYSGTIEGNTANARRIVACWNAFDGIPTEQFEGMDVAAYVSGQAFLTGMNPADGGGAYIGLKGSAAQVLANSFAGQFIGTGAINFLEINLTHDKIGDFTVTMQKASGLTPVQMRAKAEKERDELKAINAELLAELKRIADSSENSSVRGLQMSAARAIEKFTEVKTEGGAA